MKKRKKGLAILCIAAMAGRLFMQSAAGMAATKKVKLNKTKISLKEGETYKIKLKNGNKKAKVTWETSKKKVVKITQKSAKGKADASKVPDFVTDTANLNEDCAIIVGTIDDSPMIKKLMDSGKLDEAKSLKGVWEGYVIKQVKNPVDGVGNALVIAGSDARGTIYGIYTVSEAIGVSPFYWYSDVPVQVKDEIQFDAVVPIVNDGPDVKYRGIFVNDEEKSNDWAEKKFTGDGKNGPGVNYYRKVFELMLRMKANTLWPAMHNCSIAFNKVVDEDGNPVNAKEVAEYGIIMSASHCEISH